MNKKLILCTLLLVGSATAADRSQSEEQVRYSSQLCSVAATQPAATREFYLQQIKDMTMRGQSSSSLNKTEYDSASAETVVDSWLAIAPAQRQSINSPQGCAQLLTTRSPSQ